MMTIFGSGGPWKESEGLRGEEEIRGGQWGRWTVDKQ